MLDPMFAARIPRHALLAENYSNWFNVPSHGLPAKEVDAVLRSLVQRKLVTLREGHWYGLSRSGGAVWEARRRPNWGKYCLDSMQPRGQGNWSLELTAVQQEVGKRYLELAVKHGMYRDVVPAAPSWSRCGSPIYWKPDLSAWTARCLVHDTDPPHVQSSSFFRHQEWWSAISDFQSGLHQR